MFVPINFARKTEMMTKMGNNKFYGSISRESDKFDQSETKYYPTRNN